MVRRVRFVIAAALPQALCLCLLAAGTAHAAPGNIGSVATTERPYTLQEVDAQKQIASFGLCSLPQNADDFPSRPMPVQEDTCSYFQRFEATSAVPTNGGSCGGYTVAVGPMGGLKTTWKKYQLNASWGEAALTQAQCGQARLSAVAWGARCLNADCSSTQWETIGVPLSKKGIWGANQPKCFLEHQFLNNQNHYKTLNVDVIASIPVGSQTVRKRAHVRIRAESGNGKCFSATQGPRIAPAQAASTAGATVQPGAKP